jgi:large subunit ribosomal protein L25
MNKVALSGMVRTDIGGKHAAQLRREKRVPCVLYGGDKPVHFSVDEAALSKLVFIPEVNGVELELDGNKTLAIIQEKQFHPVTDRVLHVDFFELRDDKPASTVLSVRLQGQPIGVRKGGKLKQSLRKVRVKGLPANIPQRLDLDVTGLDVNQSVRVSDIQFEGLTLLERPSDVVVSVKLSKKVEVKTEGEDDKKAKKK